MPSMLRIKEPHRLLERRCRTFEVGEARGYCRGGEVVGEGGRELEATNRPWIDVGEHQGYVGA